MPNTDFIPQLKKQLQLPLPGEDAQFKMAPATRKYYKTIPDGYRIACVLCLLYPKNDRWHIVLMERVSTKRDRHSGQMSFPGGKLEPSDPTYAAGALREAHEEVGILSDDVQIIGELTPLYIPVSNFMVYPFVGNLNYAPQFELQKTEVQSVVEAPLDLLLDDRTRQLTNIRARDNYVLKNIPFFNVYGKIVWGATAMMLSEFVEVVGLAKGQVDAVSS